MLELTPVKYGSDVYNDVLDFVYREAQLLDDRLHREWLGLLTADVRYVMPVRVTSPHSLTDSVAGGHGALRRGPVLAREARFALRDRARVGGRSAVAHAQIRHERSLLARRRARMSVVVVSNLLLFRSRGDIHDHDLLSARRNDVLRREHGGLKLARREILVDESVLRTQNLAVFL